MKFGGEEVSDAQWADFKSKVGGVLVIPGFYKATPSETFFDAFPNLDGIFNWNSWSSTSDGISNVSTIDDKKYLTAAKNRNKLSVMGISPSQYKHIDGSNWYHCGEGNLENRFLQALNLQLDMIELQTWNDAGESHYLGSVWDKPITGSPIHNYIDVYDHKGYWQILQMFIQVWKRNNKDGLNMVPTNGKTIQGVFWYHPLLVSADCSADSLSKP